MAPYLASWWIRIGLALVVVGWGPLIAISVLDALGLWPDPNPNPVGAGLLFAFTAWPAIICLLVGYVRVLRERARTAATGGELAVPGAEPRPLSERIAGQSVIRLAVGLGGAGLALYGVIALLRQPTRGAAAAIVVGFVAGYWGLHGRLPGWFRR